MKRLIIIVLILAAFLRFSGTKPGYPPYHSDEGISYSAATSMIKNNNLDPLRYDYPAVVPLVNYIFYKFVFIPVSWVRFYVENFSRIADGFIKLPLVEKEYQRIFQAEILGEREINALFWGRYVTALFGVGVVFLSFLLAKELFGDKAGLISAFLVAINYRQVLNSHFGLPDIYNAFFLLLSLLASYFLWKKPTSRNYFLASVAAGLSLSVKYQFFSFLPLVLAHLDNSFKEKTWPERLKFLFNRYALTAPFIIIFVFLVLNPYHFIKLEETRDWLVSVSGKYRAGRNEFDFYPYSYLYHIGIGKLVSVLGVLGVLLAVVKRSKQTFFLLSAVIPFFWVITYLTGGGFYTRNFVTIIPVLLIFAGWLLAIVTEIKPKYLTLGIALATLFFIAKESLANSLLVIKWNKQEWNYKILGNWTDRNIPAGSVVAAHPSVPLPNTITNKVPYDFSNGPFSFQEFKDLEASFIVTNFDWATTEFYWWMTQDIKTSLKYWDKPIRELEKSFPAMAIREISDYAIYWVLKPWQAPESNFVVAKIPKYEVASSSLFKRYLFTPPQQIWNSEAVDVIGWRGYLVDYKTSGEGRGYLYLSFYKELDDVGDVSKRAAVRLSSRYSTKSLLGQIPIDSKYMVIGFDTYDSYKAVSYLERIDAYQADVKADFSGYDIKGVRIDEGVIFPNSHGNM